MEKEQTLKWRFDVSTFRLIGRDLITDRITALFELVKNCYDANARRVDIVFENVGIEGTDSLIRISDDGYGMSFEDVRDKWMVIGTSNKRKTPYSPEPFRRKCVGEKGIGRFAVDKLGDCINIITKKAGADAWLNVNVDWSAYEALSDNNDEIKLFTEIENNYSFTQTDELEKSGTCLVVSHVRDVWTKKDIERFMLEVSKIVSPLSNLSYPFVVHVRADEFGVDGDAIRSMEDVGMATLSFNINFNEKDGVQETAFFDTSDGSIKIARVPIKSFGGIKMRVYFFDDAARRQYRREYPNNQIDGIKIYRDGIITTPFAENEHDADKKRDVLGIDKRLWQDIFNRVSTREIIGIVEITKEGNPSIIDATNRQDFVDNAEYRELKEFIILQLDAIQSYKIYSRAHRKKSVQDDLKEAIDDIDVLISSVTNLAKDNPSLEEHINPVIRQAKKTGKSVKSAIKEQKRAEEEFIRKENIYMSIMSLQEYAIHITHAVRTTLNKIRDRAEFFFSYYPDPEEDAYFIRYSKEMYHELMILNKVIDYMLSYSQSNLTPEDFDIGYVCHEILDGYSDVFRKKDIHLQTDIINKLIINSNKQFFRDILQNLIDNSVKALEKADEKLIKCSVYEHNDKLVIVLSDTGYGIPIEKREWIFGIYNTTTEEQGGAGLGLYIVKTRVESLKGTVRVIDSEFGDIGTTIQIELPFNTH